MPMFRYEVMDRAGKVLSGVMSAASEDEVRHALMSKGYTIRLIIPPPIDAPPPQSKPAPTPKQAFARPKQRTSAPPTEMIVFFRQVQSMLQSGFTLFDGLTRILTQTKHRGMRHIVESISRRVQVGDRLSEAMAEFPRAFPPHVVGVVASGEIGGFLPAVLGDIALDYEIEQKASVRWIRWVRNLLWLNSLGCVFLIPALPRLPIIAKEGLPGYLHAYSAAVTKYILPPVALLIVAMLVVRAVLGRPELRPAVHAAMLNIPVVGRAHRDRSLANFSRMLWRLQTAGVLPIQAWETAAMASNNVVISGRLLGQLTSLRSGARFSQAMEATRLFREDDRRILEVGEMSGQTADILQRMALYYEDAALHSAGRVRGYGLRFAIICYVLVLLAMLGSEFVYLANSLTLVEREFEPMIWLLLHTR